MQKNHDKPVLHIYGHYCHVGHQAISFHRKKKSLKILRILANHDFVIREDLLISQLFGSSNQNERLKNIHHRNLKSAMMDLENQLRSVTPLQLNFNSSAKEWVLRRSPHLSSVV